MDNHQKQNTCYVFSKKTLGIATQEWLASMIKADKKREEKYRITIAALPWFLEYVQADASIYMFTQEDLTIKIKAWKNIQLEHFPKQKDRIEETCDLITAFFNSDIIRMHKMLVDA